MLVDPQRDKKDEAAQNRERENEQTNAFQPVIQPLDLRRARPMVGNLRP